MYKKGGKKSNLDKNQRVLFGFICEIVESMIDFEFSQIPLMDTFLLVSWLLTNNKYQWCALFKLNGRFSTWLKDGTHSRNPLNKIGLAEQRNQILKPYVMGINDH